MHPSLKMDLLGEQIKACREIGVKANIYVTLGWSFLDVKNHPDWLQYDFRTKKIKDNFFRFDADPEDTIPDCCWVNLCPSGGYLEHLKALVAEICDRYKPVDGMFFDICYYSRFFYKFQQQSKNFF